MTFDTHSRSNEDYRPDIDGLRALAVIAVLLFHIEFSFFEGGFVGVDVFFVISGFLITRLLVKEHNATGKIDFANFYLRRARRLFPALLMVTAVTFILSALLFTPALFEDVAGSVVHALFSISNFYFWTHSGYFDTDAVLKPLLHTWSLSVEEQFYLVWPITLLFLLKARKKWALPVGIIALSLFSLFLNHVFSDGHIRTLYAFSPSIHAWFEDPKTTLFFLTPFRIFELGIGASLVWLVDKQSKNALFTEVLLVLGLAMIIASIVTYSDDMVFPGVNALLPCIGAALVIYAGRAPLLGTLLRNKPVVAVGLISYSLYLIHWPLLVFWRYFKGGELNLADQIGVVILSFFLSVISYRFIELPFRRGGDNGKMLSRSAFGFACAMAAIFITVPASNAWANKGWPWRIEELISAEDIKTKKAARWKHTEISCTLDLYLNNDASRRSDGRPTCKHEAATQVLIMGDSHVVDGYNTLHDLYNHRNDINLIYMPRDGGDLFCGFSVDESQTKLVASRQTPACTARVNQLNNLDYGELDIIAVSVFNGQDRHYDNLRFIMKKHDHLKGLILGSYIGTRPYHCADLANRAKSFDACKDPTYVTQFRRTEEIASVAPRQRLLFVDTIRLFCGEEKQLADCIVTNSNRSPVFLDGDHFTISGANELARRMQTEYKSDLIALGLE